MTKKFQKHYLDEETRIKARNMLNNYVSPSIVAKQLGISLKDLVSEFDQSSIKRGESK